MEDCDSPAVELCSECFSLLHILMLQALCYPLMLCFYLLYPGEELEADAGQLVLCCP
jgi:hypothetical protein